MENELKNIDFDNSKLTGIYVELNGKDKINIQDLPKKEYENFLNLMEKLRIAYNVAIQHK